MDRYGPKLRWKPNIRVMVNVNEELMIVKLITSIIQTLSEYQFSSCTGRMYIDCHNHRVSYYLKNMKII